jgi:hypothetical protein
MNAPSPDSLTPQSLQRRLQEVEPAALLVPPRILRRVIKHHCGLGGLGLRVPHRKSYILPRDDLLRIASAGELGLPPDQTLPVTVLLFSAPAPGQLAATPAGKVLLRCWRMLFHSHVHLALDRLRAAGRLDDASMQERIHRIGRVEFEEAREVLRQENYLLASATGGPGTALWPADLSGAYEEFAAVYLELCYFDPHRRRQFFPAAIGFQMIEAVLAEDVDGDELFRRTRLQGACDPDQDATPEKPETREEVTDQDEPERAPPGWLRWRADVASRRGNQVRAAVLRQRAIPLSPPSQAGALRAAARAEIEKLVSRLQRALQFRRGAEADWSRCLLAVLPAASRGLWNREGRLLYDLQKVCVDCERDIFAVDLVEWVESGFQRPIKRLLPDQPLVLTVKHLRTAASRLPVARMPDAERVRLSELLQAALHDTEHRLRQTLHPRLVAALDAVGLTPGRTAEAVSRDKVVEELLDRVVETGRLAIGDLRDALARNRVKLPDLRGPVEFFRGDPLIRLNRRLAAGLDGIYHRGEIYLRWMQRLSSLFFGNPVGRVLTLYLILPVLGSLFILKGIDGLSEEGHKYLGLPELHTFDIDSFIVLCKHLIHGKAPPAELNALNVWSFPLLALFLLPLFHSPAFRRGVGLGLYYLWRGLRGFLYDLPSAILRLPLIRRVLQSRPYLLFYQFIGKPLAWTAPVVFLLWLMDVPPEVLLLVSAGVLIVVSALINTRAGLLVEEAATDWLVHTWEMVRNDLLPGLFRWVMWLSRRVREQVEEGMYRVDEWLRFRTGEGRFSFVAKLFLGLVWFVITYVVRFAINLLVEPQINPIKHFPVVTVSHKLMLLIAEPIASVVAARLGTSLARARTMTVAVLSGVPGIFGFLAWELKENWRLYRANQSPTVDPVMVGSHGEHVIHLIRPGFHAGTLPKLYARLRRARGSAERKGEEGLHHVKEALRHFVERDLIAVLASSHTWGTNHTLTAGEIHLATNRIRFELRLEASNAAPVCIDLANRGGRLVAGVDQIGWLVLIGDDQRKAFRDALAGFYKLSGVDFVREQIAARLPPGSDYEFTPDELIVWLDGGRSLTRGVAYKLAHPDERPRPLATAMDASVPPNTRKFLFAENSLFWADWVEQWERDRAGKEHEPPLLVGVGLLPATA